MIKRNCFGCRYEKVPKNQMPCQGCVTNPEDPEPYKNWRAKYSCSTCLNFKNNKDETPCSQCDTAEKPRYYKSIGPTDISCITCLYLYQSNQVSPCDICYSTENLTQWTYKNWEEAKEEKEMPARVDPVPREVRIVNAAEVFKEDRKINHEIKTTCCDLVKDEVFEIVLSVLRHADLNPEEAYMTGKIINYVCRWKNKGGLEDLLKARLHLNWLIERLQKDAV